MTIILIVLLSVATIEHSTNTIMTIILMHLCNLLKSVSNYVHTLPQPYQVMQSKQALEHSKEEGEKVDKQIIDEDKERQVEEEQHAQGEGKEVRKNKRRHSDGKHSTKNGLRVSEPLGHTHLITYNVYLSV